MNQPTRPIHDYLWLVKTPEGDFFISVAGNWTEGEAAKKVWQVFADMKLDIIGLIPRKQPTGSDDERGTICQLEEPEDGRDFTFLGGKALFEACGRGVEYQVERVRLDKQIADGR